MTAPNVNFCSFHYYPAAILATYSWPSLPKETLLKMHLATVSTIFMISTSIISHVESLAQETRVVISQLFEGHLRASLLIPYSGLCYSLGDPFQRPGPNPN
jgi:hypothetical protein